MNKTVRNVYQHEACQAEARAWHCATRLFRAKTDALWSILVRHQFITHYYGAKTDLLPEYLRPAIMASFCFIKHNKII
jgi:hypothetical protein